MFTDLEIISKNNTITIAKKEYSFDLYLVEQTGIVKAFVHRDDDTFGPFEADTEEAAIETFKEEISTNLDELY